MKYIEHDYYDEFVMNEEEYARCVDAAELYDTDTDGLENLTQRLAFDYGLDLYVRNDTGKLGYLEEVFHADIVNIKLENTTEEMFFIFFGNGTRVRGAMANLLDRKVTMKDYRLSHKWFDWLWREMANGRK